MFKPGDTVRLKSGGPLMTVEQCAKDTSGALKVWVVWFKGDEAMRGSFPVEAVESDDGVPVIA